MAVKISQAEASAIRRGVLRGDFTRRQAADAHGVSLETISRIVRGDSHRGATADSRAVAASEGEESARAQAARESAERMLRMQEGLLQELAGAAGQPPADPPQAYQEEQTNEDE